MKGVELYGRVRYAVQIEGLSHRAAARTPLGRGGRAGELNAAVLFLLGPG